MNNQLKDYKVFHQGLEESYEDFAERIGEYVFPGLGKEWAKRHHFVFFYYARRMRVCENCQGQCPRFGHRYELRLKKGYGAPIPYLSNELCPRYRVVPTKVNVTEVGWEEELAESFMNLHPSVGSSDEFLHSSAGCSKKSKVIQQDMFAEEVLDAGATT